MGSACIQPPCVSLLKASSRGGRMGARAPEEPVPISLRDISFKGRRIPSAPLASGNRHHPRQETAAEKVFYRNPFLSEVHCENLVHLSRETRTGYPTEAYEKTAGGPEGFSGGFLIGSRTGIGQRRL